MNPITGLLAALAALTAVFVASWARAVKRSAATLSSRRIARDRDGRAHARAGRRRRRHQLLRHARHRIVRDDDGALPRAADGAGSRHPRHAQRGHTLPTVAQAFIYTSVIPGRRAHAVRDDRRGRARRVARRRRRREVAEVQGADRDGARAARGGAAHGRETVRLAFAAAGDRRRSACAASRCSSPSRAISCSAR